MIDNLHHLLKNNGYFGKRKNDLGLFDGINFLLIEVFLEENTIIKNVSNPSPITKSELTTLQSVEEHSGTENNDCEYEDYSLYLIKRVNLL